MKLIFSPFDSPSFNLAAEEYLFSKCREEILFLYINRSSVIIGSNQVLQNEVNTLFCNTHDIQIVRRLSGGGAVYHDTGNLNYCFITNRNNDKSALGSEFLVPVVDMLTSLSIPVEIGKRKDLWLPDGNKISGTASHITSLRELHHGTLLYDTNLEYLRQSLTVSKKNETLKGIASVPSHVKNISTFITEQTGKSLDSSQFFAMCFKSLSSYFHQSFTDFISTEIELIHCIERNKYLTSEWLFKR